MGKTSECNEGWFKHKADKFARYGRSCICPIWGKVEGNICFTIKENGKVYYWSPRAGGAFCLSDSLNMSISNYCVTDTQKKNFSRWVYNNNGVNILMLTSGNINAVLSSLKTSLDERLLNILISYYDLAEHPAKGLFSENNTVRQNDDYQYLIMASSESDDLVDLEWLTGSLIAKGYIEVLDLSKRRLTPAGLEEIQRLNHEIQSEQAFVAMWFSDDMKSAYTQAIKLAVEECGYKSYRVDDDRSHSDQITNKILAEIKTSKFLIADFTHDEQGARGGVYFEAGFAMGLGIPVIWLIKDDGVSKMHFDTNHYPHIFWKTEEQLKQELINAVLAHQHIGRGPHFSAG